MMLYVSIAERVKAGAELAASTELALDAFVTTHGPIVPGFGHRFHAADPRAPRLLALIDLASSSEVDRRYATIARSVEASLAIRTGKILPMNIDGATAAVYAALGFAPPLGRGLFILSRAVGILAHAWEQAGEGARIKGPMPPSIAYRYAGVPPRSPPRTNASERNLA